MGSGGRSSLPKTGGLPALTERRRRNASRREQRALVPYGKRALPQIYLSSPGKVPSPVFLPEPGDWRATTRLKWLASTGIAAMKPIQKAHIVASFQSVSGQKSDRIPTSAEGLSTKHIIHDTVVQRKGEREYLRIKPYVRLVASLGTAQPETTDQIPAFNPFKLYSNPKPVAEN